MNHHSQQIIQVFEETLNEKDCYLLSRKTQFIQRSTSKLKGHEFIKTLTLPSLGVCQESLIGLCKRIREFNPEADISPQALQERINSVAAVKLVKAVFSIILSKIRNLLIPKSELGESLKQFTAVLVQDSTNIELDEVHHESFPGTNRGGRSCKSQCKIDVIHELTTGQLIDAEIYAGKDPDQGLAKRVIQFLKPGNLLIRDLGYFVLKVFKEIQEMGAYYLSRLLPNVKIFINKDDKEPIDLRKHVAKKLKDYPVLELRVWLGDEKLETRLIIYAQPKEVAAERLRQANKRAKDTGRKLSKAKKFAMQVALFITNIPQEQLLAEVIGTIYRLRWEIELLFKRWKSQLKIQVLVGLHKNRIECLIWGRLCMVVLIGMIVGMYSYKAYKGKEISDVKMMDYLMRMDFFYRAMIRGEIKAFFEEMEADILRMLLKGNRSRKTMRERVIQRESYYQCLSNWRTETCLA